MKESKFIAVVKNEISKKHDDAKKRITENSKRDVKEMYSKLIYSEEKFRSYNCEYCKYTTAQKWILDRHVDTVHFEICNCKRLCCLKCISNDRPKDPYRYKPFRGWC